jgi:major capsid protein E
MATPDRYLSPIDIKDSHILTKAVERKVKEDSLYQVPFAPLTTTSARKIKLRVKNIDGAGLASFKADNADTPVVSGSGGLVELFMELFLISEKDILKESDLIALASPDPLVAKAAAQEVLDKGIRLRKRNINRTKWMAWEAAKDNLTITYPDGATIAVSYDLAGENHNDWFTTSHLPTAAASWATAATDVIEDFYTYSKIIADDLGCDQSEVICYMRTSMFRYLKKNTGIIAQLSGNSPRIITPTKAEITEILGIGEIRINNEFYVSAGSSTKNYYLSESNVLFTAPDTVNGDPIMEMKDGPVVRYVNGQLVVGSNPGALSEVYVNAEQKTENVRVSTARLPQMNYPAGFVYATVIV